MLSNLTKKDAVCQSDSTQVNRYTVVTENVILFLFRCEKNFITLYRTVDSALGKQQMSVE